VNYAGLLFDQPGDQSTCRRIIVAEKTIPGQTDRAPAARTRSIWITLEGPEIIELKQIVLDRDAAGAADFFQRVIVPQVRKAARQRGIITDEDVKDEGNGSLSG
jgi:hypothetical protein